jgi:hypothetical protein
VQLLVSFVVLVAAMAMPALAQAPAKPVGEGGSVRGRIFDADTGQAITHELNIEVTKVEDDAFSQALAGILPPRREMDAVGEYVFSDLDPGLYNLEIREKGNRVRNATRSVQVAAGAITRADVYLRLPGEITAVVVDSLGQPVQGSAVILVSSAYVYGRAVYTYTQQRPTDDRGHVTFSQRVQAGHPYFLLALPPEASRPSLSGTPALEPIWYPSRPGALQPFVLLSGERKRVDLVMQKKQTYCMDGKLTADGQPAALDFEVGIPEVGGYVGQTGGTRGVLASGKSNASGHFRVCGLGRGEYLLAAGLSREFYGRTTVSIVDRDMRDIALNAHSPLSLSVEVRWDNGQVLEKTFNLQFIAFSRAMFSPP